MKIKIYIVTYNDKEILEKNLTSLYQTDLTDVEINIINNHSNFYIDDKFKDINIFHNKLRPDFSRGHLSRNWNQAIINGFKDLTNPDCDILITCQDDTIWKPEWRDILYSIHENFSFYTCGWGDALCSYKPEAVKNIGLWDERFNGISHQEADYFIRAFLYNRNYSSINDHQHKRVWNETTNIIYRPNEVIDNSREHNGREYVINYTHNLFIKKWGIDPQPWNTENMSVIEKSIIENYILYPYFEKDINLTNKNYYKLL